MKYRQLGKAGLKVSEISLGSWRTFGEETDDATTEACDAVDLLTDEVMARIDEILAMDTLPQA